jgi:endoglucanase
MTDDAKSFFFELLDTPSPTGFETPGQRVWAEYVRDHADAVEADAYGTAWATLEGTADDAPRVMLDAHADEIGFMVRHITDKGFIHVNRIGGSDRAIARGLRVRILGDDGPVTGVVGNTAIHIRDTKNEKVPKVHELFVDIGASSEEEVHDRGIRVGHPMVFDVGPTELTDSRITARAIDNRLGGFIIAQAVARLAEDRPSWQVQAANSVQEEIGGHGAKMIAHRLEPDAAIAFDVTHATDSPGIDSKKHGGIEIGEGPTVTHGTANHPQLVERVIEVAEAEDIPLQHMSSSRRTGTDTDSIFKTRSGVPSVLLSVPLRYMHSTVEVVDTEDIEHCVQLYAALVRSFSPDEAFGVEL